MKPGTVNLALNEIHCGNALTLLRSIPDRSVQCCVTSPPYLGLRDYGDPRQIGMERTPEEYIEKLVVIFREVRRVLRDDGTLWLNIGDSYWGSQKGFGMDASQFSTKQASNAGSLGSLKEKPSTAGKSDTYKPKDLIGIPWMLAFALRADGWYLRQDIIWAKPNSMPESITDRCTKSHEYIFLLAKSPRYYYDQDAIREKLKPSSIARLSQPNLEEQEGSDRVPGKTNGNMKAVQQSWHGSSFDKGKTGNMKSTRGGVKPVRFGGDKQCPDTRLQSGNEWHPSQGGSGFTPEKRNTVGAETGTANKRSVWFVTTQGFKEAHFATFPPKLIIPCIKAGSPEGGIILDPFMGAGTTAMVAKKLGRQYIGIELNAAYIAIANKRLDALAPSLFDGESQGLDSRTIVDNGGVA